MSDTNSDPLSSSSASSTEAVVSELMQAGIALCLHGDLAAECNRCARSAQKMAKKKLHNREKRDVEEAIALQKALKLSETDYNSKSPLDNFHEKELKAILIQRLKWVCQTCTSPNDGLQKTCRVCLKDDKTPPKSWECPECAWDNNGYRIQCSECNCFRKLPDAPAASLLSQVSPKASQKPIFQLQPL